jgi:hypothetical protein
LRGDFHQVQVGSFGFCHRLLDRNDPEGLPFYTYQSHLASGDFTVEALRAFLSYLRFSLKIE